MYTNEWYLGDFKNGSYSDGLIGMLARNVSSLVSVKD